MAWKNPGNRAFGELSVPILATDLSLTLGNGQGGRWATLGAGDWYMGLIVDEGYTTNLDDNWELVRCTARAADTFTFERNQEDTIGGAKAFPRTAGAPPQRVKFYGVLSWRQLAALTDGNGALTVAAAQVLTVDSPRRIFYAGLGGNIVQPLPTTKVWKGLEWGFVNLDTTYSVTIQASGGGTILVLPPGRSMRVMANQDEPTTAAHWTVWIGTGAGGGVVLADTTENLLLTPGARYTAPVLTANRTKTFNASLIAQGQRVSFFNADSAESLILAVSGDTGKYTLKPKERIELEATADAPTLSTQWLKVDGTEKLRVFSEITRTFPSMDPVADTIPFGTNDGYVNSQPDEWDKAFFVGVSVGGLLAATAYYIVQAAAATLKLSLTPGGTPVDITATGSTTLTPQWIAPLGVQRVRADVYGGGGGGGTGSRHSVNIIAVSGAGGGSGAYSMGIKTVTPGAIYAVTVGNGGALTIGPGDQVIGLVGQAGEASVFLGITAPGAVAGTIAADASVTPSVTGVCVNTAPPGTGGDLHEPGTAGSRGQFRNDNLQARAWGGKGGGKLGGGASLGSGNTGGSPGGGGGGGGARPSDTAGNGANGGRGQVESRY